MTAIYCDLTTVLKTTHSSRIFSQPPSLPLSLSASLCLSLSASQPLAYSPLVSPTLALLHAPSADILTSRCLLALTVD